MTSVASQYYYTGARFGIIAKLVACTPEGRHMSIKINGRKAYTTAEAERFLGYKPGSLRKQRHRWNKYLEQLKISDTTSDGKPIRKVSPAIDWEEIENSNRVFYYEDVLLAALKTKGVGYEK